MYDSKKATRKVRRYGKSKRKGYAKVASYSTRNRTLRGGLYKLSTGADPFPNTKFCRLVWGGVYTLTVGASVKQIGSNQVFNLNSLHTPVSGGHQPYGHDELATLYRQYKVYGVKVDIVFSDPSADGLACCIRFVPPKVSADMAGEFPAIAAESPMTVCKFLNTTGTQQTRYSQYLPISTICGITPLQFKASVGAPYSAVFGTNPADMPTLRVGVASLNTSTTATVECRVTLTYYAQIYERQRLASS